MIEEAKNRNVHKGHEAAFTIEEIEASQSGTDKSLVIVGSQGVAEGSLSEALHVDRTFATSTMRGSEESSTPRRLSWCTGNNEMFAANGKTPLPAARGWFIDKPDEDEMFPSDYELLDAMEALVEQGRAREVQVEHRDQNGGKNRRVPSWELYDVSLFVVCKGVPSKREMDADGSDRWGVAYGWQPGEGGRSQVRFHCFIKELMDAGYHGLFIASFSSHCTSKIIAALNAQQYVLDFVNKLRARMGDTEPLPFYAYALPIKCSVKSLTAGKPPNTTEVYYPIPAIPRLSEKDPETARAYLVSTSITDEQQAIVEHNGRIDAAATWSVRESARILAGKDGDTSEEGTVPTSEAPINDVTPPF